MAQRGARVIKVENPLKPDRAKAMSPPLYADLNHLKEVISLNLLDQNDRSHFNQLLKQADGLIEAFRPEAKRRLGLDPETLHKVNSKLCIASLVGYPEDGPWKDRAGHDLNFAAVSGCASLFHEMPALPLADLFSAYEGALALTTAMDGVTRGAAGSRVVVSMSETLKNVQSCLVSEYLANQVLPQAGQTFFSGKFPCYRIYLTQDGRRVSVGAIEPKFWQKFCEILNLPHLTPEAYASGERGLEVIQEVQTAFSSRTWLQWAPLFEKGDCCVEAILDYSEVFKSGL